MPLCSRHVPASRVCPMSQPIRPAVSLCVPTFRRPDGLRKLLSHVARLDYQGPLSVIVVDNDADQLAGKAVVRAMAPGFPFRLTCVVEPRRGQTYACNTAFATACRAPATDYVAVLDDGQYPAPTWLAEMIATAIRYEADIVGGPVFPVFDDPDHWLARGGLTRIDRRYSPGRASAIRRWGTGIGLIAYGLLAVPIVAWRGRISIMAKLLDAASGVGRLAAEFDIACEEYRAADAPVDTSRPANPGGARRSYGKAS